MGAEKGDDGAVYAIFAQELRNRVENDSSKRYYFSASPQCIYPDAQVGIMLSTVALDNIYVQFYNNPSCRANNYASSNANTVQTQMTNFLQWDAVAAGNPSGSAQWYIGMNAVDKLSNDYVKQSTLTKILESVQSMSSFGGAMLW